MCGICGVIALDGREVPGIERRLEVMSALIEHRGPDDSGVWVHEDRHVGFAHRRLSIIDIEHGHQPMTSEQGRWITYNGELYNFPELRREIGADRFRTASDTEVVLRSFDRWGTDGLDRLRGMFAYAVWDEPLKRLVCVRDRFGIKPLYYTVVDGLLHFASEAKALLPVLPSIEIDLDALKDYLAFQFCLAGKTLFKGVHELPPGHCLIADDGGVHSHRYWEVYYDIDSNHTAKYFEEQISELLHESVDLHMRSDVPVAAYLSGGLDSSVVATLASDHPRNADAPMLAFTGKFSEYPGYDESEYARAVAEARGMTLEEVDIGVGDFVAHARDVIYQLDYPVAGPGSFPQFMVSQAAARECKVIVGGQGGDEIFGGYTRYLIAYFEQCIKAAIDGTSHSGNFVVTYESIIPNLVALQSYKPLLQQFWRDGLFDDLEARYFRLINRTSDLDGEVDLGELGGYSPYDTFCEIFNGENVGHEAYFDKMTHFDFKTLLPALLQVEDRVSMAHGLESRVPLLDHRLVELAATIPADVKFKDGEMKHVFRHAIGSLLPERVAKRKDKMGFPVPLTEWFRRDARDYVADTLSTTAARQRSLFDNGKVLSGIEREGRFSRKAWGLFCLEVWQQTFHDREAHFKALLGEKGRIDEDSDNRWSGVHRVPLDRPVA
jgi:asparagine synthase (glutamine-hydrolysing)